MRGLTWISAAVALIVVLALAWVANEADAQQGTPPGRFFSGPVIFGPPRVAGPFRGRRPVEVPTAGPVGTNVNVTGDNSPQNETAIAVSSVGTLFAAANDYRQGDLNVGAYRSTNGGATWSNVILKLPGGLSVGGDPSVAFDNLDDGYAAGIGFNRGGPTGARDGTVLVWKAQFGDFTGLEDAAVVAQGSRNLFHDKPYIGTGNLDGIGVADDVFISWTAFSMQGRFTTGFPILFSRSLNGGTTWSTPEQVSDGDATQGSVPVNGDNAVYVVFYDFGSNVNSPSDDFVKLDKSTDGGATWGTDVPVANVVEIPSPLPGWGFRTNSFPSIGTFPGASDDDLYVVFASDPAGAADAADVFFTRSMDGGSSWSSPVPLNDDGETNAHQFFPWLAVGPNGVIHVVWYDTRSVDAGPTNAEINLFYTSSSDGGGTWSANERVSAQGFVPNSGDQFGGAFIGDYNGIAATNPKAHPVWTGYRGQDQDIFYAAVGGVPNDPPTAAFVDSPYGGEEDTAIMFDGSDSEDPDGDDLTYDWDFGDGTTASSQIDTFSHTYLWGGTFTVTLTVSDGNGGTDTATTPATVDELNDLPVANAGGPYNGTVNVPISFDGSASSDPDNQDGTTDNDQTLTYNWDFGDTTMGTGLDPSHAYTVANPDPGYDVTLTVYDGFVNSLLSSTTATVQDAPTGNGNDIYVWDIVFESRTRGGRNGARHDERIAVTVRRDSDANGVADATDQPVSGVAVTVDLTESGLPIGSSSGPTNSSGVFRTGWFTDLDNGTYTADVTLDPGTFNWSTDLDVEADEEHTIPHP